ncbi:MAG: hypothetical protein ACRD1C_14655 [Terriglobales bacterium]
MSGRIYTKASPSLVRALEAAPELGLVSSDASRAERLSTLALLGYEAAVKTERQTAKLRAYQLLAEDEERADEVRYHAEAAVESGRF